MNIILRKNTDDITTKGKYLNELVDISFHAALYTLYLFYMQLIMILHAHCDGKFKIFRNPSLDKEYQILLSGIRLILLKPDFEELLKEAPSLPGSIASYYNKQDINWSQVLKESHLFFGKIQACFTGNGQKRYALSQQFIQSLDFTYTLIKEHEQFRQQYPLDVKEQKAQLSENHKQELNQILQDSEQQKPICWISKLGNETLIKLDDKSYSLKKTDALSQYDLLMDYILHSQKDNISKSEWEEYFKKETNTLPDKPMPAILSFLGFTKPLKKVFFPKCTARKIIFKTKIYMEDLKAPNLNIETITEIIQNEVAKKSI